MFVRKAAVAGMFYPGDTDELQTYLNSVIAKNPAVEPKEVIVPHAGYAYSGFVAAKAYSILKNFDTYIILAPNHTGLGKEISVFKGVYEMPFGDVETDDEIADSILSISGYAEEDYYAHLQEHSVEVQLPFIDFISDSSYKIIPIVVGTHNRNKLRDLGYAVSNAIMESLKKVLIVVSSDMNHYENRETTLKKDALAIGKILELDEEGFFDVVESYDISMCGAVCAYSALIAAKELNAKKARLIEHKTSGDVNGDYSQVVGYASIVIE